MAVMTLTEAIARHVQDGQSVALEGFTHLIPFAAGHEIIRQRRKNLHLIRMTPDPADLACLRELHARTRAAHDQPVRIRLSALLRT